MTAMLTQIAVTFGAAELTASLTSAAIADRLGKPVLVARERTERLGRTRLANAEVQRVHVTVAIADEGAVKSRGTAQSIEKFRHFWMIIQIIGGKVKITGLSGI